MFEQELYIDTAQPAALFVVSINYVDLDTLSDPDTKAASPLAF